MALTGHFTSLCPSPAYSFRYLWLLIESEIYTEKGPKTAQISMKEASQYLSHAVLCQRLASCYIPSVMTPLTVELEGPANFLP